MWRLRRSSVTILSQLLLLLHPVVSVGWDCKKAVADGVEFNFDKLGGYHQVSNIREKLGDEHNMTFRIDICKPLKLENEEEKGRCGKGTHICAVERAHKGGVTILTDVFPIMRTYFSDEANFDPTFTRLKTASSNADSKKEGLRLEIGGGKNDEKQPQRAVIEFVCNKDQKAERGLASRGADPEPADGDTSDSEREAARNTDDRAGGQIQFVSYEDDRLRLNWLTPYGCEDAASAGKDPSPSGGWGFFSWFFFIIFMGLLGFILFTAWINYSQHGARGWDLLPYSDTIRDVPYILGDWGRKIIGTLNGGGSRGGYSAV